MALNISREFYEKNEIGGFPIITLKKKTRLIYDNNIRFGKRYRLSKRKKLLRNLYYKHGLGYRYLYGKTEWELPEEER